MESYSVVGKEIPNIDSLVKVKGAALYAGDIKMPGMLIGKILRSPHAHAKILSIDTTRATRLPGVKIVITGKDTLGVKYGVWRARPELLDEEGLAMKKVRFIGDAVAAVAAIDEDTAQGALELIQVDYEPLPAVFTPEEAMKEGAPLVHDGFERNVSVVRQINIGDIEKGFNESDYVREDRFVTPPVQHSSMEPHVCVADFDASGKLTIWDSTQSPYFVQVLLATTLGLRENDVRVVKPHVGGGFGNKVEMFTNEFCASLLSRKTGRPTRIEYTREEELTVTRRRQPEIIEMKTGVKNDGTIVARESRIILDGGAYNGQTPTTILLSGVFSLLPYRIPNYRYHGSRVYTNNMPSGAMRGHGALPPNFASEVQLDLIAGELGIDPVELRLKNAVQAGDNVPGIASEIRSCGLSECIKKAAEASDWQRKRKQLPEGRGIGIACYTFTSGGIFNWFNTDLPFSEALVKVNEDGTVNLYTRAADLGQGSNTVLSQILAEELGIKLEDVKILAGDTETSTADLGAWSSRITIQAGNAVKRAALDAKGQIFEIARESLGIKLHEELEAKEGRIYIRERPDKAISFAEAVCAAKRAKGGMPVMGRGSYTPRGKGMVSAAWSFGAQVAEIELDRETGIIRVLKLTTAHDCGKAINPLLVDGQLQGSAQMGVGGALSEQLLFEDGRVQNPSFRDYKLFTAADMPEVESIVVETYEPEGPFGAKEAGEGLTIPTGGAVSNAVLHATGVAFKKLPITPERVVEALEQKA
jgi:4-hydroxybenzoyl-CoA reductase subunit alpha